ncbi:MAG: hypothetical protein WCR20_05770, partial [Verrucomicrobiota bacterium]
QDIALAVCAAWSKPATIPRLESTIKCQMLWFDPFTLFCSDLERVGENTVGKSFAPKNKLAV